MKKTLDSLLRFGKNVIKPLVKPVLLTTALLAGGKAYSQTPTWYDAFSPRNEVVNYFGSYGSADVDQDGDVDMDDLQAMETTQNFYSDVDADGQQSTAQDKQILTDYLNGVRVYMPAEFWRSTPSEKEGWVRNIYPIMTELNNYTYNSSADPDEFFDSDRFSVGDFLTGNGYSPNRDDFNLIHPKYNLEYNGLFNIPIYIARVHSDDGTFNHGFSVVNKGTNLQDPNSWIFLEPQLGQIVEAGSQSVPFNSKIIIYGVHNFEDAYNLGDLDQPRLYPATELHIDGTGNREVTYLNPVMIEDQTSLGIEDNENTNISDNYMLNPNYPNPFNSSTTISYSLSQDENVELNIFNLKGKKLETLVNGKQIQGEHKVNWDASKYSSGIYFYQLGNDMGIIDTKKMIKLK